MTTRAEQRLICATECGQSLDLRTGDAAADDPANGESWDGARTISAALVVRLLAHADEPRAVRLAGARIVGRLGLEGITMGGWLLLSGCWLEDPVTLAYATGPTVRMPGCHLPALAAEGLHLSGDLALDGLTAYGEVTLARSRISGNLSLAGAKLHNQHGTALDANRLTAAHHLRLDDGFTAYGEVHLSGAQISGDLVLTGARLSNRGGTALSADQLTVRQDMACDRLTTDGQIRMTGARVGGSLKLGGAHLAHAEDWVLTAPGLTVTQGIFCDGVTTEGGIDLRGAHLGALVLDGATLNNPGGTALEGHWCTVDRQVSCRWGFTAVGQFSLYGAKVGTRVDLRDGTFSNAGDIAMDFERLDAAALYLLPRKTPDGSVDLSHARVQTYHDDSASWPETLDLRGFVYQTLMNDQVDARSRLRWLERQPSTYLPQPYDQLGATYRSTGQEDAARRVAIAKQWRRRRVLGPVGKLLNWLLYLTVGYGYRSWLAALWLVALLALGTGIFASAHPGQMIPTGTPTPAFNPVTYTLDVLLPIVDLGQQKAWTLTGGPLYWSWALAASGWILTTAVVAGLGGVLKRD